MPVVCLFVCWLTGISCVSLLQTLAMFIMNIQNQYTVSQYILYMTENKKNCKRPIFTIFLIQPLLPFSHCICNFYWCGDEVESWSVLLV